jgi:hypothetical protein
VSIVQHFQKAPTTSLIAAKTQPPAAQLPAWHLRVTDFSTQKIFIGFMYKGRVYMDASRFCMQPNFRTHADNEGRIKIKNQSDESLLLRTPDIVLPGQLASKIWSVVSAHPPEQHVFDTPYQWLSFAFAPSNGACLFFGKKTKQ